MQKYEWKLSQLAKNGSTHHNAQEILQQILKQRGIDTPKKQQEFLHPSLDLLFDIPFPEMEKAVERVKQAISKKEKIIVFSDYDADGINAAAILWETINEMGGDVLPYMPKRMSEGYGLSVSAVEKLAEDGTKLIITVDNGITCVDAVNLAKQKDIDVIITDHHQKPEELPKPHATVWSDQICGAAVAYVFSKHLLNDFNSHKHLDLAALATVTDVMPLVGANRAIVKFGLEELNKTKRVGLQALFHEAGLEQGKIDAWTIGHVIGPRLNAMGRLEDAMDSLRLLCTNNPLKAKSYALLLAQTNSERQKLTEKMVSDAKLLCEENMHVGVLASEEWHEGVVGLVAGRMVEFIYRPVLAISKGPEFSKGSARSIPGFNIIETLRSIDGVFEKLGGHPMAAGFTLRTEKIEVLREKLTTICAKHFAENPTNRTLTIDAAIPMADITIELYKGMQELEPYGNANPELVFLTRGLLIEECKKVGSTGRHVKLIVSDSKEEEPEAYYGRKAKPYFEAIGFGMADTLTKVRPGDYVDIVYTLSLNNWHNIPKLELKIKDIRLAH